jgi:hypothetical protein
MPMRIFAEKLAKLHGITASQAMRKIFEKGILHVDEAKTELKELSELNTLNEKIQVGHFRVSVYMKRAYVMKSTKRIVFQLADQGIDPEQQKEVHVALLHRIGDVFGETSPQLRETRRWLYDKQLPKKIKEAQELVRALPETQEQPDPGDVD